MKSSKPKLIRVTTVAMSLDLLLEGQLHFLNESFDVIAVSSGGETLKKVALREGVPVKAIEMSRNISVFRDMESLFKLFSFFRKEQPHLVHANTPKASLLSMVAAYFARVPHRIYTVTGLRFEGSTGLGRKLLMAMEKITCYFATKVIPEGQGVKETLLKYKITSKELKVIANGNINGIDSSYFSKNQFSSLSINNLRKSYQISTQEFVFVFVGRIVQDKGVPEMVTAFKKLLQKQPSCTLLLVGPFETDLDPLPTSITKEIESNNKIVTTGYQKDVRQFYAMSDALVFPSYREGFPNVVLQAGAMGLPSIVTNINGCNEIIQDGINGIIVPVKDAQAVYEAMHSMVADVTMSQNLSEKSREMIVDKFDRTLVWNELLKTYKAL